jgi:hypothetical protein
MGRGADADISGFIVVSATALGVTASISFELPGDEEFPLKTTCNGNAR